MSVANVDRMSCKISAPIWSRKFSKTRWAEHHLRSGRIAFVFDHTLAPSQADADVLTEARPLRRKIRHPQLFDSGSGSIHT